MILSKKAKKVFLYGTESRTTRQDRWIQVLNFRLFVRDRHGVWIQITENTKISNPVLVLYDAKRGGGVVSLQDPLLCEFTDAMLFWEDAVVPCNLLCFTKEEDAEEYNILKISANGKRISELFDRFLLWADKVLLHSNLLEEMGTVQSIISSNMENDSSEICEGEQER